MAVHDLCASGVDPRRPVVVDRILFSFVACILGPALVHLCRDARILSRRLFHGAAPYPLPLQGTRYHVHVFPQRETSHIYLT